MSVNPAALAVMEQIASCEACDLHAQCTGPVPFHGPTPAQVAVIGEAPGEQEDNAGRPFVGPAGQMIRKHLAEVGIDPDGVFWCNTASCFPHGTPHRSHVDACRPNLMAQLELAEARWILVLGKTALNGWRPDIEIRHGRSRPFWPKALSNTTFFATYHPAAALRKRVYELELAADIERFAEMVTDGDPVKFLPETCATCSEFWCWIDEDGFTWCADHAGPAYAERQALLRADYEAACRRLAQKGTA